MLADGEPTWVQVEVAEIRRGTTEEGPARHAAVLRERGGERRLAIWMGQPETVALASSLESYETPRPMTYQFGAGLLRASRSTVAEVRITRLADSTFYALVLLDGPAGPGEVDALNLALVVNAPIRIDALLLDDADVVGSSEWKQYPTHAAELVAELDERHRRDRAALRARRCRREILEAKPPPEEAAHDPPGTPTSRPRRGERGTFPLFQGTYE